MSEKNEKVLYVGGTLLNPNYSSAVIWSKLAFEVYEDHPTKTVSWPEGSLKITDCNNNVNLEINFDSEEDYKNSLEKLQNIENHVSNLKIQLVKARKEYLKHKEKEKKLHDKNKKK